MSRHETVTVPYAILVRFARTHLDRRGRAVLRRRLHRLSGSTHTQMPSGTWGYFCIEDGRRLPQPVGLAVEQGKKIKPTEIVGPGKALPNYTVKAGHDLRMMSGSITVSKDTLLSDILKPNMGPVHLAICRDHCDPRR
ncbi:putative adhesin [Streptomyces sp. NPDC056909]|uniref:putative adhesin n=1 Tax=Streptomyces sp. NPDC056909 TaxID=3345963 RepID=UPI0036B9CB4F